MTLRLEKLVMDKDGEPGVSIYTSWDGRLYLTAREAQELCEKLQDLFPEHFDD